MEEFLNLLHYFDEEFPDHKISVFLADDEDMDVLISVSTTADPDKSLHNIRGYMSELHGLLNDFSDYSDLSTGVEMGVRDGKIRHWIQVTVRF